MQWHRTPHPARKQVTLAGGSPQGARQTTSVPIPAARRFPGLGHGQGAPGQGHGCLPSWAHARGLKPTLTQREEQSEASEEQGGLREPGFRADRKSVV